MGSPQDPDCVLVESEAPAALIHWVDLPWFFYPSAGAQSKDEVSSEAKECPRSEADGKF